MFSARTIFEEIFDNDEAFQLFCSIAASGEGQGGWENGRIAALVPGSQADLAPKIARHGAHEDKHGRIFNAPEPDGRPGTGTTEVRIETHPTGPG